MRTNFEHWKKFAESRGSKITKNNEGLYKVEGDLVLVYCGLTHIPQGLAEVTGTLDISLNPIENFECDLKKVRRLICMGSKPICLKMNQVFLINGKKVDNDSKDYVYIEGYKHDEIMSKFKYNDLIKKLPELEGVF